MKHEHDDNVSIAPLVLLAPRRSARMRRKRALSSESDDGMADGSKDDIKLDSPSPTKRIRGYAAPETYAHLNDLPDILTNNLDGGLLHFQPFIFNSCSIRNRSTLLWNQVSSTASSVFVRFLIRFRNSQPRTAIGGNRPSFWPSDEPFLELPS